MWFSDTLVSVSEHLIRCSIFSTHLIVMELKVSYPVIVHYHKMQAEANSEQNMHMQPISLTHSLIWSSVIHFSALYGLFCWCLQTTMWSACPTHIGFLGLLNSVQRWMKNIETPNYFNFLTRLFLHCLQYFETDTSQTLFTFDIHLNYIWKFNLYPTEHTTYIHCKDQSVNVV